MGMTTNERLFETALLGAFDEAVAAGDAATVRAILKRVYVDDYSIEATLRGFGLG